MAQQQAAAQVAKLLSRVGRWGIILGVGGSALQASLYTGEDAKLSGGQARLAYMEDQTASCWKHGGCMMPNPGSGLLCCAQQQGVTRVALSLFAVDGGERAVMYDRLKGVLPEPIGEGTHVRIPWLQSPTIMDIRTRPRSISSVTGTQGKHAGSAIAPPHPAGCDRLPASKWTIEMILVHFVVSSTPRITEAGLCPLNRPADGEHHAAGAVEAAGRAATHNFQGAARPCCLLHHIVLGYGEPTDLFVTRLKPQANSLLHQKACGTNARPQFGLCCRTWAPTGTSVCCRPLATRL
jgi:hypothetical protein